jgi:hypothetical protein
MSKTISIFNSARWESTDHFFETLESEIWLWKKCFNCQFCWDIITENWIVKDSVVECLWKQSWISNIKIWESCAWHEFIKNYGDLRKWD